MDELEFEDIDVQEIREMAIKHFVDTKPKTNYPQVEAIVKSFLRYCNKHQLTVKDGKVYKTR